MTAVPQATGTGYDAGDGLRRRNVPTQAGAVQGQPEADDKKKLAKQVGTSLRQILLTGPIALTSVTPTAIFPRNPQRVGVGYRAPRLYCPRLLHPSVQDRPLQHCDMGRSSVCALLTKCFLQFPLLTDLAQQLWQVRIPLLEARILLRCPCKQKHRLFVGANLKLIWYCDSHLWESCSSACLATLPVIMVLSSLSQERPIRKKSTTPLCASSTPCSAPSAFPWHTGQQKSSI